ncbi:hypothetical protein DFH07DRAFT_817625 [Mycena maculata]|uniref:Uncharacterized protein n=1 Tax=Mycena maculata TaxID=230809 RepID=A0AAD7J913_9AGAR|nr:hypothetical protein DFH07DRAFT_817625 [Mycena maculata]
MTARALACRVGHAGFGALALGVGCAGLVPQALACGVGHAGFGALGWPHRVGRTWRGFAPWGWAHGHGCAETGTQVLHCGVGCGGLGVQAWAPGFCTAGLGAGFCTLGWQEKKI